MFYVVHTPTNVLFINLVKSFKFTLKYTIISLLHVSVFNDHKEFLCITHTVEHNYISSSSAPGLQLHVSALYVGHLQAVT